jgi:hypothetical protein
MDQDKDRPNETSTARENHLSVVMNVRAGTVRIMSDAQSASAAGAMRAAMREAQERSGVRLLTTAA